VFQFYKSNAAAGAKGVIPAPINPLLPPPGAPLPLPCAFAPYLRHLVARMMFAQDVGVLAESGEAVPVQPVDLEYTNPAGFYKALVRCGYKPMLQKMADAADPRKGNYMGPYREVFQEVPFITLQAMDMCKSKGKGAPKDEEILPQLKKARSGDARRRQRRAAAARSGATRTLLLLPKCAAPRLTPIRPPNAP
jgi:hypothetical protein